jgi:hypothetical protein
MVLAAGARDLPKKLIRGAQGSHIYSREEFHSGPAALIKSISQGALFDY